MATKHLSCDPQPVNDRLWYYEQARGIEVIHEIRDGEGHYMRTDSILIPWWKIRASLARKDRPAKRARGEEER